MICLLATQLSLDHPFIEPLEVHQVQVTIEHHQQCQHQQEEQPDVAPEPATPRHTQEKKNLLQRLRRDKGHWVRTHPRYRLLDALYGYTHYYERQVAEIDRLKGLYKRTTKDQKAVCRIVSSTP